MTGYSAWLRVLSRAAFVAAIILVGDRRNVGAFADSAKFTLPAAVSFAVTNVTVSTTGSPSPTPVSFSNAVLNNKSIRISIRGDGDFVPPSGTAIPASKVTWTTSGAVAGTGSNGTLINNTYTQIFQSNLNALSGSFNITWTLQAPGTGIRAGAHVLTVRWKLDAV
jgi:hypothetical protein